MHKQHAQMRGIVVAGDSVEHATQLFRAVATNENVQVMEDEEGTVQIVTSTDSNLQLLNPVSGEELKKVETEVAIEGLASSSDGDVEAVYVQCTAGCDAHIIASSRELLQKCPACASDLPDLEDEPVNKPNSEAIIAFASSAEEAAHKYAKMVRGEAKPHTFNCDNTAVASSEPMNFDVYSGTEAVACEHSPTIFSAVASAGDEVEAHHFVCVSKSCGTHVIASDETPLFCPECSAGLIDPVDIATASDDEDDEDVLTLSVSSDFRQGGVRRRETATAADSEGEKLVSISASYIAIAADQLTAKDVELAYAGDIAGEKTWLAFHQGVPFAKAVASNSKFENFASDLFSRTFRAIAQDQGIPAAMRELGFNEIKPEVKVDQLVQTQIQQQVEELSRQLAEAASRDASELNDRFLAAIATASRGLNSGFFKGLQNPIRVALASALEDAGIRGGEQLVTQAFAKHGDSYHKMLVDKASEIMRYDLTVQNQIATAVSDMQMPDTEVAVSSSVPVGRPVVSQTAKPEHREVATASSQSLDSFSAKLKTLRF